MDKMKLYSGIWKIGFGTGEKHTPMSLINPKPRAQAINAMPESEFPFDLSAISFTKTGSGCVLKIPMDVTEDIYGFGLQLYRCNHTKRKKLIRVNSDPVSDTGDSHAPVPFYVSSAGYGLLVNSARYITFYCGTNTVKGQSRNKTEKKSEVYVEGELYEPEESDTKAEMIIDIPTAQGIDIILFAGSMKEVVQRYNLYSGGGCLPPMWGLGMWYRAYGGARESDIYRLADEFRKDAMPMDVMGLEPGWHSRAYSCSFKWDNEKFPAPDKMINKLAEKDYKVNLWEHVFVHPTADIYNDLMDYSGDYEVWGGLVPDLSIPETRKIFGEYHGKNLIDKGVSGFKLDECDNSDYNPSNWSFPDCAIFPSGMDGELMHNMLGQLYQETLYNEFRKRNKRTLSQVRSSGALASHLPYVLYSDLYNHKAFIRGVVTSGFSGLLWAPEVRSCSSSKDLIRRVQTIVFSPHALLNCWTIPNPPWKQVDRELNLSNMFMDGYEDIQALCRKFFELRMSLIPYLYSAFVQYYLNGIPPFRALAMDYPEEKNIGAIDDIYMMGDSLLVAPMTLEDSDSRNVYLPTGTWYDFWTDKLYEGGGTTKIEADITTIPVFVKSGAILPFAKPVQSVSEDTCFEVSVRCYGKDFIPFVLYEDDGVTFEYEKGIYNSIVLTVNDGKLHQERAVNYSGKKYDIVSCEFIDFTL